jgi:hypothetical protein
MWWHERNAQSFEDVETLVIELWKIMFDTFYTCVFAHHSLIVSSFADFLNLCYSLSLD